MYRIKFKPEERERLVKLFQSDNCPGPTVYFADHRAYDRESLHLAEPRR